MEYLEHFTDFHLVKQWTHPGLWCREVCRVLTVRGLGTLDPKLPANKIVLIRSYRGVCSDLDLPIVTAGGGGGEAVPGALEVAGAEAGVAAGGETVPGCEAVCPDNSVIRHLVTCY